jgi:hypothetical protein
MDAAHAWLIDPLKYLPRFKLPRTIEEAEEYLSWRLQTATLLWICAHYLPGKLPLRLAREQDLLLPTREEIWSEGEGTCQHLIAWSLIPFYEEGPEMMALEEGARMEEMQLVPMGMDHWTNGFGEYNQGWLMLGLLDREAEASAMNDLPEVCKEALSHAHPYRGTSWSDKDLVDVCRREGAPYDALPTAIHILDHSTENLFLDPTYEAPLADTYAWGDREGLEFLIGEWQQAQEMQGRAEQFTEYLAAHPSCLRKVVDLWNLGLWNMAMR